MARYSKKGGKLNARLAFLDESGMPERPSVRRTWAPMGKTPVIFSTGSWKTRSVIGVITCTPKGDTPRLYIRIYRGAVRQKHEVVFLKELRRHERGSLILLWDRLSVHRAKTVKEYIASCTNIATEHFPSYAPELNPVEYVWATGKNHDVANILLMYCAKVSSNQNERPPRTLLALLKQVKVYT